MNPIDLLDLADELLSGNLAASPRLGQQAQEFRTG
jgi:hypothetical protein